MQQHPISLPFRPPAIYTPFKREIRSQRRGKPVTLALGFQCRDGIVLGADSEISGAISKWSEKKILHFPRLKSHPYFAYATDDVDFAKNMIDRLKTCIDHAERGNSNIVAGLKGELKKIRKEYGRTYPPKEERPICDLLLVLRKQRLRLFLLRGVECTPVAQAEYIGIGEPVARSIATPLFNTIFTTPDAGRLAVYVLMQAKEYVRDVGKRSDVVQIWENPELSGGDQWWYGQDEVKEMEEDFAAFQKSLQPILTGCYFSVFEAEGKDEFREKLRVFSKAIEVQRRKRIRHAKQLHKRGIGMKVVLRQRGFL